MAATMSECSHSSLRPTSCPTALTPLSVLAALDQLTYTNTLSAHWSAAQAQALAGRRTLGHLGKAASVGCSYGASSHKGSLKVALNGLLARIDLHARISWAAQRHHSLHRQQQDPCARCHLHTCAEVP